MNLIWCILFVLGSSFLMLRQSGEAALTAMSDGAQQAVTLCIALAGAYLFWLGLLNVAKKAGLVERLSKMMRPFTRFLLPDAGEKAIGAVTLNFTANLLGMGSAATPFGLEAIRLMQQENPHKERATHAMCTFLCVNASSLELIPTTLLALRSAAGCLQPTAVVWPTLLASLVATVVAVVLCCILVRRT